MKTDLMRRDLLSSAMYHKDADISSKLTQSDFDLEIKLDVKKLDEEGEFEGYGSVFNVVDSYGEVVVEGAFTDTLKNFSKSPPLLLWQHRTDEVIGVWLEMREDKKGLYVRGKLLAGVQRADEALILLRAGAIRGMSIGYRIPAGGIEIPDKGPIKLLKLDLWEVSLVSFPANRRALVQRVKSEEEAQKWERLEAVIKSVTDGNPLPPKEFEDILREAGASKSIAAMIVSGGYVKAIRSESGQHIETNAELAKSINRLSEAMDRFPKLTLTGDVK